jgi:hypothetical protein
LFGEERKKSIFQNFLPFLIEKFVNELGSETRSKSDVTSGSEGEISHFGQQLALTVNSIDIRAICGRGSN